MRLCARTRDSEAPLRRHRRRRLRQHEGGEERTLKRPAKASFPLKTGCAGDCAVRTGRGVLPADCRLPGPNAVRLPGCLLKLLLQRKRSALQQQEQVPQPRQPSELGGGAAAATGVGAWREEEAGTVGGA